MIVQDIDELAILNDEAHHPTRIWLVQVASRIIRRMLRRDRGLSLQVDVTGDAETQQRGDLCSDVPAITLVEDASRTLIRHTPCCPMPPAAQSWLSVRARALPKMPGLSAWAWRSGCRHPPNTERVGKKAILCIMTDDAAATEVAEFLKPYLDLKGARALHPQIITVRSMRRQKASQEGLTC